MKFNTKIALLCKTKFPGPKTFRGATSPATLIKWALGIGILEYPTGHPRRVVSLCWSGICLIIFLCCVRSAVSEDVWDLNDSTITRTTYQTSMIVVTLFGVTYLCLGQVSSKNVVNCFCEIDRVNELLNKLGIPNAYGSTFKSQIVHSVGGSLLIFIIGILPIMYNYRVVTISVICSLISGMYIIFVSFLEDFTFISCIRYISKRFQHLNMYLNKLSHEDSNTKSFLLDSGDIVPWLSPIALENHLKPRSTAVADEKWILHILGISRKIHRDLCNIAMIVNEAFGIQILMSMTTAVGVTTTVLFNTYTLVVDSITMTIPVKVAILTSFFWIGFYGLRISWIITACSKAASEAHQTGLQFYEFAKPTTSHEIREEIHAFSLQLMENPLRFTACGFFTLDPMIIRAMVGTITTYLVIMIQIPRTANRDNGPAPNATISQSAINTTV